MEKTYAEPIVNITKTKKEEHIYEDTRKVVTSTPSKKDPSQVITEKYDVIYRLQSNIDDINLDDNASDKLTDISKISGSENSCETGSDVVDNSGVFAVRDEVTFADLLQVETFLKGNKTQVFVCSSLANLYFISATELAKDGEWNLVNTGIPALLLDSGETKSRTRRRIQIILSEKGTGFTLWQDTIDNLTNYKATENNFHTMFLSTDHRKIVGFSFDNITAAKEFYEKVEKLTSDPANISLSMPMLKKLKKKKKPEKVRLPKKSEIGQPCCFVHVTKVDLDDRSNYYTLTHLTPESKSNKT